MSAFTPYAALVRVNGIGFNGPNPIAAVITDDTLSHFKLAIDGEDKGWIAKASIYPQVPPRYTILERLSSVVEQRGDALLSAYGAWCLRAHRNDGEPGDIDGGELQDAAVRFGILMEIAAPAGGCGDRCQCSEGDQCFRYTAAAVRALEQHPE